MMRHLVGSIICENMRAFEKIEGWDFEEHRGREAQENNTLCRLCCDYQNSSLLWKYSVGHVVGRLHIETNWIKFLAEDCTSISFRVWQKGTTGFLAEVVYSSASSVSRSSTHTLPEPQHSEGCTGWQKKHMGEVFMWGYGYNKKNGNIHTYVIYTLCMQNN